MTYFDANTQQAIDFAAAGTDAANTAWSDRALSAVRDFAIFNRQFTCVDVRLHAEAMGLPLPTNKRAWGSVMQQARIAGIVTAGGFTYCETTGNAHSRPVTLWMAA